MKFLKSLQAKYMLIIVTAIFFVQIITILVGIFLTTTNQTIRDEKYDSSQIEQAWHDEASKLQNLSKEKIEHHFATWKNNYPDSSMFWINHNGKLALEMNVEEDLPTRWTPSETVHFIKERYDEDPFTVIAFLGSNQENGFIVFELPRKYLDLTIYDEYGNILLITGVLALILFISVSFLFFRGIRKRLLSVQEAMSIRDVDGLPIQIDVNKQDEIGQLEHTFNKMVDELKESKQKEQEEEQLRRQLIANLSHDLRTPLTKIQSNLYSLSKIDNLGENRSIESMNQSVQNMDELIENLMSYTLLTASKYKYNPEELDIVRFVRSSLASWYPVFEEEKFEINVELTPFDKKWMVDPLWMERILDNLFQNVLRHAKEGRYVEVKTKSTRNVDAIIISDHGKGMKQASKEAGSGIGLSIVDMMVLGMNLEWDIETNEQGTTVKIKRMNK